MRRTIADHRVGRSTRCTGCSLLGDFYSRLLDWPIAKTEPGWAVIDQRDSTTYLSFQSEPAYVRPVWPATDGNQQMMTHLDIEVDDLPAAVADAIDLGATAGPPAGPICLCPVQRWSRTCSCKRAVTMSRTPAA